MKACWLVTATAPGTVRFTYVMLLTTVLLLTIVVLYTLLMTVLLTVVFETLTLFM